MSKFFQTYVDGGYTNNLPIFVDLPTITVSPFSGSAIIAPHDDNPILSMLDLNFRFGSQDFRVRDIKNILLFVVSLGLFFIMRKFFIVKLLPAT